MFWVDRVVDVAFGVDVVINFNLEYLDKVPRQPCLNGEPIKARACTAPDQSCSIYGRLMPLSSNPFKSPSSSPAAYAHVRE
jgi:hypothetical protein